MNISDSPLLDTDIRKNQLNDLGSPKRIEVSGEQGSVGGQLDKLFLNNLRPSQATDFLAQHIGKRLSNTYQLDPGLMNNRFQHGAQDAPAAVNKLIQLANHAMRKLAPQTSIPTAAQGIRQEIDHGFNEAMDIFGVFGGMEKDTQAALTNVRDLLNTAYQHAPLNGDEQATQALLFEGQRTTANSATSINIETAEGDIVTIELSHAFDQQDQSLGLQRGTEHASLRHRETNESLNINIQVQGDLSDEEKGAIARLVKQLTQASDQFDRGHEQGAAQQAQSIQFDESLISAFEFNHTVEEQTESIRLDHTGPVTQTEGQELVSEQASPIFNSVPLANLPVKDIRQTVISILAKIAEFRETLERSIGDNSLIDTDASTKIS